MMRAGEMSQELCGLENKRILLVDDLPANLVLLKRMVEKEGYFCLTAENGEQALACVAEYEPDLILLDVMMPGLSGYDVVRELKSDPAYEHIPIILVTALTDQSSRQTGLEVGAEDFVTKPFDRAELVMRMRNLLRLKEFIDQANMQSNLLEEQVRVRTQNLEASHTELHQAHETLKEAQHQLVHSEKMAALGQLSAGVAHEINNPVGYISSNINAMGGYVKEVLALLDAYDTVTEYLPEDQNEVQQLLQLKQNSDISYIRDDILELLEECGQGVDRVRTIVRDLKDFAHPDADEWQWVNLHKGLDSTLNVVWNELKYKADVKKEYGQLPEVQCLPSQLNQIWMNFLVNASHAIVEKGDIYVRTGMDEGSGDVWVEIEDTGSGMTPDVVNKIFNPFFTTKPVGQGTGLGLSIVTGIVEKHCGKITVDSEPGRGTRLRVTLPVEHHDREA